MCLADACLARLPERLPDLRQFTLEHTDTNGSPIDPMSGDWTARIEFARRVAFVLRLGERAVTESATAEHQALPAPGESKH